MRNSGCVIAQVVNGKGPKLAEVMELSESRVYEILSTDNPYPKTKRLIRAIAQIPGCDVSLIKADLDAMFDELLGDANEPTVAELFKEDSEAIQAILDDAPRATQRKEIRDVIAAWTSKLDSLDRFDEEEQKRRSQREAFKGQPVNHGVRAMSERIVRTARNSNGR